MLDIPHLSTIDKELLVGGCVRLPIHADSNRLASELENLPLAFWGTTGGRVGVHRAAEAVFLRGYAPAEGETPIVDREALGLMPYARQLIEETIPAPAMRCLLAKLPAGATIAPHIDQAPYFSKTLRLHFPIVSHEHAWMMCAGGYYRMQPGEVWAINNSALHAVWNDDASRPRTHMICDFLPTAELLELIATGNRDLGLSTKPPVQRRACD